MVSNSNSAVKFSFCVNREKTLGWQHMFNSAQNSSGYDLFNMLVQIFEFIFCRGEDVCLCIITQMIMLNLAISYD